MKIYIPQDIADSGKDYLISRGYEIKMGSSSEEEVMIKEVCDCDGLIVRTARISGRVIEAGKKLKVISRHGVGVDNIDVDTATRLGIKVTNAPFSNTEAVAEHTVAFIMALAQRVIELDKHVRSDDWDIRNRMRMTGVSGKTVGMIGFGRIAEMTAKKLALGLDMKIIAYSKHIDQKILPEYVEAVNSPEDIYRRSDFISLHCPANDETKNMINKKSFSLMKPDTYLVNCARGELIVEQDLYEALKTGVIQGAAVDVLWEEPVNPDNPLLKLNNIIFSPHCGAHSKEGFDNMSLHAAIGIDEVLSKKQVTWPVN